MTSPVESPRPGTQPITQAELNERLCRAFDIDPVKNAGFRLTVLGGEWPALEVFQLLPADGEGRALDGQLVRVEDLMSGQRLLVVPATSDAAAAAGAEDFLVPDEIPARSVTPAGE